MSNLRRVFLYGIYFIAVFVLGAVIVKSFYPSQTASTSASSKTTQHQVATSTHKTSLHKATTPATTTPKATPTTTAQSRPATASSNKTLENTGPGNIFVVFILATVVGALGYRQVLVYQRQK